MTNIRIDGLKVKVALLNCGETREKVVVLMQDILRGEGMTFSLAGLDKMCRGELPRNNPEKIVSAFAKVMALQVSDFAESEAQSA